jgi:hypothetical protein
LNSIQKRILQAFSDKFTDKSLIKYPVLLVGPAYHGNVGDNMLNYGELMLMEYFSLLQHWKKRFYPMDIEYPDVSPIPSCVPQG